MRPVYLTQQLVAAAANAIALSQKPLAAGNLTLNGSTGGVLDTTRIVAIASDADDSGVTFTITGTNNDGGVISEVLTGPNAGTVSSVNNYKTVTSVRISAAATGNITVGTTGIGATDWLPTDYIQAPFAIGFGCEVAGTVNYTIQHTFDDPYLLTTPPIAFNHPFVLAQTTSVDGNYAFPVRAVRLLINSGTGSVRLALLQGSR